MLHINACLSSLITDFAVLSVPGPLTILEGDDGDTTVNRTCFAVTLNQPRSRDVVFVFTVSNMSTATPGVDFEFPDNITISPGFSMEEYMECLDLVVLGDDIVEDDELIVLYVRALAEQDVVESEDGSSSLRATIVDNDGMLPPNRSTYVSLVPRVSTYVLTKKPMAL